MKCKYRELFCFGDFKRERWRDFIIMGAKLETSHGLVLNFKVAVFFLIQINHKIEITSSFTISI